MDSLKTKQEFDFVYHHGFLRYGNGFALYVYKIQPNQLKSRYNEPLYHTHHKISKLGFSVSRKVGSAVVRNLLKRRVRMICREYKHITYGYYLIFVAKPSVAHLHFTEFQKSFHKTLAFILQHLHTQSRKRHTHTTQCPNYSSKYSLDGTLAMRIQPIDTNNKTRLTHRTMSKSKDSASHIWQENSIQSHASSANIQTSALQSRITKKIH